MGAVLAAGVSGHLEQHALSRPGPARVQRLQPARRIAPSSALPALALAAPRYPSAQHGLPTQRLRQSWFDNAGQIQHGRLMDGFVYCLGPLAHRSHSS